MISSIQKICIAVHTKGRTTHLNLRRTKIQQVEHKIKQKPILLTTYTKLREKKAPINAELKSISQHQNWNSLLRSTKSRPRYFSRTTGFSARTSGVPSNSTRPSNSR